MVICTDNIKISSVTINWNGARVLEKCLNSLKNLNFKLHEIIVVDNNSDDHSIEMIQKKFPDVVLIANRQNLGAPAGRNVGLRRALEKPVDYVFTLDNDLFADSLCVDHLVKWAEKDTRIGTIGAFIYDAISSERLLSGGGIVDFSQNISRQLMRIPEQTDLIDVDYCGTGAMLTRRKVFDELGLPDEIFVGYGYEDTDFGMRVHQAGYRVCTCPTAHVWHMPHSNIGRYTFRKKYLESRNAIIFMRRHGDRKAWIKFLIMAFLGLFYAFVLQIFNERLSGVFGKFLGLVDGILNREALLKKIMISDKDNYL